jgi:RND superfamily putative drug exporter
VLTVLARFGLHRRRLVLVVTAVFLALAGAVGGGVAAELSGGGFDDPQAESIQAARLLEEQFGSGNANLVLLVTAPAGVDDPPSVASALELVDRLDREPGVTQVTSWWTAGRPEGMRSRDGDQAVILARMPGADDAAVMRVEELGPRYAQPYEGLDVQIGGLSPRHSGKTSRAGSRSPCPSWLPTGRVRATTRSARTPCRCPGSAGWSGSMP